MGVKNAKNNKSVLYGESEIDQSSLNCFDNPNKNRRYEISITLPEFTCKCPFSGYPDFATIKMVYQPYKKVLELKSLKLYINRFRDQKISHEAVANQILDDFIVASEPHWMRIEADFNPRGNVHTNIVVCHGRRDLIS